MNFGCDISQMDSVLIAPAVVWLDDILRWSDILLLGIITARLNPLLVIKQPYNAPAGLLPKC